MEPLLGLPADAASTGEYLYVPGQRHGMRQLIAALCDLLGRGGVVVTQPSHHVLPALGERGNAVVARGWLDSGHFGSMAQFAEELRAATGRSEARPTYHPLPLELSRVTLPAELAELTERLAEHAHDVWAQQRIAEGWRYGPARDDTRSEHPDLVPYRELTESEKEYDRAVAGGTLRAIVALGFRISAH